MNRFNSEFTLIEPCTTWGTGKAPSKDPVRDKEYMYYTYVIKSKKDKNYYTGCTKNLRERLKKHNNGEVQSTKGRGPFELIYYEACTDKKNAFRREKYLKSGPGKRYLKNRLKRSLSRTATLRDKSLTGFTLIELLIVIGIIAILAGAVIVAINPGRQFAATRDVTRKIHINALNSAILSYQVSAFGSWGDLQLSLGSHEICNTNKVGVDCVAEGLADMSVLVTDGHINQIPVDPQKDKNEDDSTGYFIEIISGGFSLTANFEIESSEPEGESFVCGTIETLGDPDTLVSYHGHDYNTIQIGDQCWLQENLTNTNYRNGDEIPYEYDDHDASYYGWSDAGGVEEGVQTCAENDCAAHEETYGRLYSWYAVDDERGICPEGWSVPSHNDWSDLERFICMDQGGSESACNEEFPYLGEEGDPTGFRGFNEEAFHLIDFSVHALNTYEFKAVGGANYILVMGMSYNTPPSPQYFWSSTFDGFDGSYNRSWRRAIYPHHSSGISRNASIAYDGYSVRCIKD